MEQKKIAEQFESSCIYFPGSTEQSISKEWNAHPSFQGVWIKHLIKGNQTGGTFSAHLVKVSPGCSLIQHKHELNLELHEVIEGSATAMLGDKILKYEMGNCAVIPKNTEHSVTANDKGLYLLAKFFPPLL